MITEIFDFDIVEPIMVGFIMTLGVGLIAWLISVIYKLFENIIMRK